MAPFSSDLTTEPSGRRRRFDPMEAERIMFRAGVRPLTPFPGVHKPWLSLHEACGAEIAPLLSNVRRRGTACRQCGAWKRGAARRARHAEAATSAMLAAGFEPLVAYPGSGKPWLSRHMACGQQRKPTLSAIRSGGSGCRPCGLAARGWRSWTPDEAVAFFESIGLSPLEPYPGSSTQPWRSRHILCGRTVRPRLGNVAHGQGPCRECGQEAAHRAQRLDDEVAGEFMRERGLEPATPFPGVDAPWECVHLACGRRVSPSLTNIKRGQGGCTACAQEAASIRLRMPQEQAVAAFCAAGLTPVEPYAGSSRPWAARHECGRIVTPTLSNVRQGRGICRYCNSAFPFAGPATLYLVRTKDALKVGMAALEGHRIRTHEGRGWKHVWSIDMPTGDDAYNFEQAVLRHWRDDLGLPATVDAVTMPQGGASETVSAHQVSPKDVLSFVLRGMEEQGFTHPRVHTAEDSTWHFPTA